MRRLVKASALTAAGLIALTSNACVNRETPHPSWPMAVKAGSLRQFNGVYRDQGDDSRSGKPTGETRALFDFLIDKPYHHQTGAQRVELSASPDESGLRIRLLDSRGRAVTAVGLRKGVDFRFKEGRIEIGKADSGAGVEATNLGAFANRKRITLSLTESSGLLGRESESGAGLLFFMVPFGASSETWYHWPRLSH